MTRDRFRYFAIFGAMRTGSNLLERNLNQFENITCHGELFNPGFIGKAGQESYLGIDLDEREKTPDRLIRKIINKSDDALPGFRIFQGHDPRIFQSCLSDPDCAKIILRRRPLDSYISLKIAKATDQWMLGNAPKRRTAIVTYNGAEYRDYLTRLGAYDAALRQGLQLAGQTAFEIRYEDLKSPDAMNGLAAFLGLSEQRGTFDEKIKRQNPEPLREKVANFDEMMADLGALGVDAIQTERAPETEKGLGARDLITCTKTPLLFAPIPGVDSQPTLDMMAQFDGCACSDLKTGMNQRELAKWLDEAPDLHAISVIDHPLDRAYRVFMTHIFPPEGALFPKIRRRLKKQFDVPLPDSLDGWSSAEQASSFEQFLVFLKSNLAGQTSIRIDPIWEAQHKLLAGLFSVQPIARVIRSTDFESEALRLAQLLQKPAPTLTRPPAKGIGLPQIYSNRLENLARAAYAKDYRMFGFKDWAA